MRLSTSISCRYSSVDDLLQESIHLVIIRAKFLTSPFFHTISFWIFKLTFFTKFIFRPFTLSFCYTVVVATLFVIFVIGVLIHNFIFSHSHLKQFILSTNISIQMILTWSTVGPQWAAVMTNHWLMSAPPQCHQILPPGLSLLSSTIQGNSPKSEASPPILCIFFGFLPL